MKMKNKKEEQIAAKKKHLAELKNKKNQRRNEPVLTRAEPSKDEKPTILIVCEGENTEPSYFRQFRLTTATIKPVGEGYNTISLVRRAIHLSKEKKYDQVWCVFDADPKPDNSSQLQNFNNAIHLAARQGFGVAYSNQAFEYWLILHFEDHQGGKMSRRSYNKKINSYLKQYGFRYDGTGSKEVSEDFFELLWKVLGFRKGIPFTRTDIAIERAKKNHNLLDHTNPAKEESSTTVFNLVEELKKYM